MIYIFRKEMKKWHTVLWAVFAALAVGSGFGIRWAFSPRGDAIGSVNGRKIYLGQYHKALSDIHMRLNMLRPYARMYGISEEMLFKNILGMGNPEDAALDSCVRDSLIDAIVDRFNIKMSDQTFKEELIHSMPAELIDEQGYINMDAYQQYLSRLSTTARIFEKSRRKELKRDLVQRLVTESFYVPAYVAKESFDKENSKKSFIIATVPFARFLQEAEKAEVAEVTLKDYYEKHKEAYRIPEKRKAKYWQVSAEEYAQRLVIDDDMIKNFYEKNKSKLFRIAPKIKVRHILIKQDIKKAQQVLKEAQAASTKFVELVQKYSQDEATAKKGGLLDFFGRGTHDTDFEKEAFKLQNAGDLSGVVKTKTGYEIIQLVERQKAEEKPLESVRDEIVKTMRTKKAVAVLRGDLETMMHAAVNDTVAFDEFVKIHKFEAKESDWLTADGTGKEGITGTLAQKLFAPSKKVQSFGYFVTEGTYTLYQVSEVQKSVVPSFESTKAVALKNYQTEEAERALDKTVRKIKAEIFDKKGTLDSVAAGFGLKVIKTGLITNKEKEVAGLDKDNAVARKAFILTDACQVLQSQHEKDFYLAQLQEVSGASADEFMTKKQSVIKKEKLSGSQQHASAFIASLQRHAKIDVSKNRLTKMTHMRDY